MFNQEIQIMACLYKRKGFYLGGSRPRSLKSRWANEGLPLVAQWVRCLPAMKDNHGFRRPWSMRIPRYRMEQLSLCHNYQTCAQAIRTTVTDHAGAMLYSRGSLLVRPLPQQGQPFAAEKPYISHKDQLQLPLNKMISFLLKISIKINHTCLMTTHWYQTQRGINEA